MILVVIMTLTDIADGGPFAGFTCYWACMGLCTAGTGAFAGLMSAGVATASGVCYGAAACATTCSSMAAGCTCAPTP